MFLFLLTSHLSSMKAAQSDRNVEIRTNCFETGHGVWICKDEYYPVRTSRTNTCVLEVFLKIWPQLQVTLCSVRCWRVLSPRSRRESYSPRLGRMFHRNLKFLHKPSAGGFSLEQSPDDKLSGDRLCEKLKVAVNIHPRASVTVFYKKVLFESTRSVRY